MAGKATCNPTALYVYGIVAAENVAEQLGSGVENACVEALGEGDLAAIGSRLRESNLRPQRSNLTAHHRVLSDLDAAGAVLPVAFGMIAGNEDDLREMLARNRSSLRNLLSRVWGKVEMGLKVYWDTANAFEYLVATHRELEAMRDRLFQRGRTPTTEEKIELGRLFQYVLKQSRERHTQRVVEALSPYCAETCGVDPGEERMIMKLACLVEKNLQPLWEEGVHEAASHFDNHYRFEYSGPWPPYSFVDVDVKPN